MLERLQWISDTEVCVGPFVTAWGYRPYYYRIPATKIIPYSCCSYLWDWWATVDLQWICSGYAITVVSVGPSSQTCTTGSGSIENLKCTLAINIWQTSTWRYSNYPLHHCDCLACSHSFLIIGDGQSIRLDRFNSPSWSSEMVILIVDSVHNIRRKFTFSIE